MVQATRRKNRRSDPAAAASRPGQPRKMIMLLALAAAGANEAHDWVIRDPATIRCAANEFLDTIELVCQPCSVMATPI